MAIKILQWNIRYLIRNFEDLRFILQKELPDIFCIQETWLKEGWSFNIQNYNLARKDSQRLGSSLLNYDMFKRNQKDSPNCPHCNAVEDLIHFLWQCPKYSDIRNQYLSSNINITNDFQQKTISTLQLCNPDENFDHCALDRLIQFIKLSKRFQSFTD